MKEKILNALKTTYAKFGLGDKAFDGVASFLEKTITDEKDIATRIAGDDVVALLKGIQGETDTLRTARTKAERDLDDYKKAHPSEGPADPGEGKKDPEGHDDVNQALLDRIAALEARNAESDRKARRLEISAGLRAALKSQNCSVDPILDLVLSSVEIGDNDTVESLSDKTKSAYQEKYKLFYGNGAVPPIGENTTPEPYKKGMFSGVVSALQQEGALPEDSK